MEEAMRKMSTIEDIYNLPEDVRAELIDGELYMMGSPGRRHQRVIAEGFNTIYNHIRNHGGPCEVNVAPFAVFLFNDNDTYVEPDITVVCDPHKLDDKGCHGAPDWIVEVISPSSRSRECLLKLRKYEQAGVREYWVIDPEREMVTVYRFETDIVECYGFDDQISSSVCEGLTVNFSEVKTE